MRYWLFQDLGLVLPGVRIRGDAAQLQDGQYAIYVHEVPVTVGEAHAERAFVPELEQARALHLEGPRPRAFRSSFPTSSSPFTSRRS